MFRRNKKSWPEVPPPQPLTDTVGCTSCKAVMNMGLWASPSRFGYDAHRRRRHIPREWRRQSDSCALHFMHYNFARPHKLLTAEMYGEPTTPAMRAGVTDHPWSVYEIVQRVGMKTDLTRGGAMNFESYRSTFLYATPSWKEGVGRLVDFANTLTEYNRTFPPENPDTRAIAQDWLAVGDDLRSALAHPDERPPWLVELTTMIEAGPSSWS